VVDQLAELATVKTEIVNVLTDGLEVHVLEKTEELPPPFTERPLNLELLLLQLNVQSALTTSKNVVEPHVERVTQKPVSARAKRHVPAARAVSELQKLQFLPLLNQRQNLPQNQTLNVQFALTNVQNVVETHVVLATDQPVNAHVNPVIPVVLAVTSVVESALLPTKSEKFPLQNLELLLPH